MGLRYSYKTDPFSHQKKALKKLVDLEGKGGLFMEMGTGKTKVAIDYVGIGFYNWNVRRVLVVCPLSVVSVWPQQIRTHAPYPSRILRLTGSTSSRAISLRRLLRNPAGSMVTWVVINYEGIWRETDKGDSVEELLKKWKPDVIIYDESHRLKSPTSKQSRSAHRISQVSDRRLLLTGTAITKNPMDAFGQFRAMDENIFSSSWFRFKNRYGIWGGFGRFQLIQYRNLPDFISKVRQFSFRVRKDQCLDLPPKLYEDVPVTLSPKAMALYREMAEEMIIEIEETYATAPIILVKLLRLSQITSGFIKDVEGKVKVFDDSKLRACMDLLDDILEEDHKVVVFVRFTMDIQRIAQELSKKKIGFRILSGSVPSERRDSILSEFHNDPDVRVFVSQIQAGSLGIDLTPADIAIFYSLDYNAANYWQAQDRLHRIGQSKKVTYYHLVVPRTIDRIVLQVLKDKEKLANAVLHDPRVLLG